jgi:tetratricopeptide (TPR) repeat protein
MRRALAFLVLVAGCLDAPTLDEIALEKYEEANKLYDAGKFAEAVPGYEYVIKWRDRVLDAYFRLATCHEKLGRPEEAITVLVGARRVDPVNGTTLRALARLYAATGHHAEAIEANAKIVELYPDDQSARDELARLKSTK